MQKFDKILITVVLASFVPFVTAELDVETVYELLTRRIDNIQTNSQILRNKINDMDDKMDNSINNLDQQIKTLGSRFDSFEDNTEKLRATVEMLIEAMNNNTETQKLETDIERNVNTQALTVRKMLSDEKSILRQTVEELSRNVNAFRDNITIQISAFVKGVQAELIASNTSFDVKLNELVDVVNKNSISVEKDIRQLSFDISSKSEDLNLTFISEIDQMNKYLNTSLERMKVIHGQWSSWSNWSSCSNTCTKTRLRHCNNPYPSTYGHMCQGNSVDTENCHSFLCDHKVHVRLDGVTRIVHSLSGLYGRLYVSLDGEHWGTVCDDSFDDNDAKVVCRMLGKPGYSVIPASPDVIGPIFLDDLRCSGDENSLVHCRHRAWGQHDCGHNEDVALNCY